MIYEIENKYFNLIQAIFSCKTIEEFNANVANEKYDFDEKNLAIAKEIKNLQAEAAGIKEAIDNMRLRYSGINEKIGILEGFIINEFQQSGLAQKLKCPELTVQLNKNPPSVVIFDEALIPDVYKVVKEIVSYDKITIKKDIQDGFAVDGARVESSHRLVIK